MGRLSTHVLDTARGKPAGGVKLTLDRIEDGRMVRIAESVTNSDGRTDAPLLEGAAFGTGAYQLTFGVRAYFEGQSGMGASPFLDEVPIRFTISDGNGHYHVPLLVTPWSFSTYRGS